MMKRCSKCGETKDLGAFSLKLRRGVRKPDSWCKACCSAVSLARYHDDPEPSKARARLWAINNREAKRISDRSRLVKDPRKRMVSSARERARRDGIEFSITIDDISIPQVCPVLGLVLVVAEGKPEQTSPSLDRIDNSKGYIPGNIRVISYRANRIKCDATPEELRRVLAYAEGAL